MSDTAITVSGIKEKLDNAEGYIFDKMAERDLLAMLVGHPDRFDLALEQVGMDKIFGPSSRGVFWLMTEQAKMAKANNSPPDFSVMSLIAVPERLGMSRLEQEAIFKKVDATRHIAPLGAHALQLNVDTQWALTVGALNEAANKVNLIRQGAQMVIRALDKKTPSVQVIGEAQDSFLEFSAKVVLNSKPRVKITSRTMDDFSRGGDGVHFTHLPFFSNFVHGFQPGKLYVIAARTKTGKSMFKMDMALDLAVVQGSPTLYLDTEMTDVEVGTRAISSLSGVAEHVIFNRMYRNDPAIKLQADEAYQRFTQSPFQHEMIGGLDITVSVAKMQEFKRYVTQFHPGKVGVVFYDYLKLPSVGSMKNAQEFQLLGEQTSKLKNAASALGLVVIAGVQESRGAKGLAQAEYASDGQYLIAGSDRISHMCDMLCNLRNITKSEHKKIFDHFGARGCDPNDSRNNLAFNQVLHITLQRSGGSLEDGIPLFYRRGWGKYTERAYVVDIDGRLFRDEKGWLVKSKEIEYLHSGEFSHSAKTLKGAKSGPAFSIEALQQNAAVANAQPTSTNNLPTNTDNPLL